MGQKKRGRIFGLLLFALAVALLIAIIDFANWIPEQIRKGTIREYDSIEEVQQELDMRDMLVPAYFPETYVWPPSLIYAQSEPFRAVVMEFEDRQSGNTSLVISQADSEYFIPDEKIKIVELGEEAIYDLKGRNSVLETGVCENGDPCSRISWGEDDNTVILIMRAAPFELIRIAESMID